MKRFFFLYLLTCMATISSEAKVLIPMDNGLPSKVRCTCFDSLGNFYAVTGEMSDSIRVYKWDDGNRKWSLYAAMAGTFSGYEANKASAQFLYGDLIISGIRKSSSNHSYIYKYKKSGNSWTSIARVAHGWYWTIWGDFVSHKMGNKIYFAGHMDSFNGISNPGIMSYNGSTFSNTNNPTLYLSGPVFASRNDTLFIQGHNGIRAGVWTYTTASGWSNYYLTGNNKYIYAITVQGNSLVISEDQQVKRLRNGVCVDSFQSPWNRPIPTAVGNRIIISPKDYSAYFNNRKQTVYSLDQNFNATAVFRNQYIDSGALNFSLNGNKLYVHGNEGIKFNSNNYNWIGEIQIDSIKDIAIDTVLVRVYADLNKNDVFEGTDFGTPAKIKDINSDQTYVTNSSGLIYLYPLDNEDIRIQFEERTLIDTCFKAPYTGARSSFAYNSPLTKDTIDIPVWRTTLQLSNVSLFAYGIPVARLANPSNMMVYVSNLDCDAQSANATVTVKLDPNTTFISSTPAYTAKTGNVLTYTMNIASFEFKHIDIKLEYPNTSYSIGQTAAHSVKVSVGYSEDTTDNIDTFRQKMVYSYDPNAKHCYPEGKVKKEVDRIRYTIEFQNEGNDDAWRVTIVDTLNMKIPVVYFQMVGASHPYTVSNKGNVVTWVFDNLKLRPKSVDEAGSKGYLVFDAKLNTGLRIGDSITNKAYIYFDLNEPIKTNMAFVMRTDQPDALEEVYHNNTFKVYPNPGTDIIYAENVSTSDQVISIYDARGVLIKTIEIAANSRAVIDTEILSPGIYLFRSMDGTCLRFVKQ